MIKVEPLLTIEQFQELKEGDLIVYEYVPSGSDQVKLASGQVFLHKPQYNEIIMDKRLHLYFNYKLFLEGTSNLKSAVIITQV